MSDSSAATRLLMNRQKLDDMRREPVDERLEAGDGEVVFRLDLFSLTTNNITYAAFGDAMNYWAFFPVADDEWGQMPVWGYADVVDSAVPEIETGQRYFGYFPTATHLRVRPGKISRHSFRDDSEHRRALPEVYNWYQRTDDDAFHDPTSEPLHAIYRPLFITAFSLADFLRDNAYFGAGRVLVSSASSKTGYATAFCLKQHDDVGIVGLTSKPNVEFVQRTGLYDEVLTYEELEQLETDTPALYIDIAGNQGLRERIHDHLTDGLVYDCTVGSAQSIAPPTEKAELRGPKPRFFFAPEQIAKRHQDWGVAEFNRRAGEATARFYKFVGDPERGLLSITEHQGLDMAEQIIGDMLRGEVDPAQGHIIRV